MAEEQDDVQMGLWMGDTPIDIWDQQVDETEEEWNARLERAQQESKLTVQTFATKEEAEAASTPATASGEDYTRATVEDVMFGESDKMIYDTPVVTACPPPTQPMTIEALEQMAAAALANIKAKKAKAPANHSRPKMEVTEETGVHYIQESFVDNACTAVGGTGDDCMMCNGSACRFCGRGCWDKVAGPCDHNETVRHTWDPEQNERRSALQEAEMIAMGISEARRAEMMDKIFLGDPSLTHMIYCFRCKKEVKTGDVVNVTSAGTRHMNNCLEGIYEPS